MLDRLGEPDRCLKVVRLNLHPAFSVSFAFAPQTVYRAYGQSLVRSIICEPCPYSARIRRPHRPKNYQLPPNTNPGASPSFERSATPSNDPLNVQPRPIVMRTPC